MRPGQGCAKGSKCNVSFLFIDFLGQRCVLHHLDVTWVIAGTWKQRGIAKHILQPSKGHNQIKSFHPSLQWAQKNT
jgi:hypothetical protein